MENCKISEAEAERVLVKRVNNRPNAMATYGMAKMGPTDTKDIFDKQFALVKEKHNLLVDKTADIYQEQERMSEQVNVHNERLNDIEDELDNINDEETDPTVPDWAKRPNKPSYSKDEVGLGNVDNVRQYSASNPPPYPVTSVNGQTWEVSLGAGDVGAMPSDTKIPAKTSDITNDSGFITKVVNDLANYYTKSQTFTREEVNAKISSIPKFAIEVVSSLPTSNISATTVYLVGGGSGNDLYTEYIYANGKWEILGAQTVDLTGYATETWVNTQLGAYLKQTELDAAINSALAAAKASGEFDGADGKTPVKGTDYFTPADITEMVNAVINALPKYNGEVVAV